eukprot:824376-Prymnesium_polylepis.1
MSSVNSVGGCVLGGGGRVGLSIHSYSVLGVDAVWLWCSVWSSSMHGAVRRLDPGVPDGYISGLACPTPPGHII